MTREYSEEGFGFLSILAAGKDERRLAQGIALVSVAICVTLLPFTKVPLPPLKIFIPIYESVLVMTDLITAVLMFGQFVILSSRVLYCLACGYVFTSFIEIAHALTFPGVFSEAGLLGGGMQTAAWLFVFWLAGFPLCVIAYVLQKGRPRALGVARTNAAMYVVGGCWLLRR